jgi:hypothetical protein
MTFERCLQSASSKQELPSARLEASGLDPEAIHFRIVEWDVTVDILLDSRSLPDEPA